VLSTHRDGVLSHSRPSPALVQVMMCTQRGTTYIQEPCGDNLSRVVLLVKIWFVQVDTDTSPPSSAEVSPSHIVCPAWEGLGKGFLDLALGLVAPLDSSCPRVLRAPSPCLSDQERMENALALFNRELDERLGSIAH
jgi:hypothetical protein